MSETVSGYKLTDPKRVVALPLSDLALNIFRTNGNVTHMTVVYDGVTYKQVFAYDQGILSVGVENEGEFTTLDELIPTVGSGAILTPLMSAVNVTLVDGGGDYSVNDELDLVGGVVVSLATKVKVTAVDVDGAITAFDVITNGAYTTLPTNPAASTGGGGTGAQFNATWKITSVGVDAAGTGYTQDTVITPTGDIISPPALSVALTTLAADSDITGVSQWVAQS